jgi:hypothetical protein
MEQQPEGLSQDELAAEGVNALPDKEVVSILDLNADLDLAIDAAAPIDLAVAANANVAAPIDAAVGANVLSTGSEAQALSDQGVLVTQGIDADATADAAQDSTIDQAPVAPDSDGAVSQTTGVEPTADGVPVPDHDALGLPTTGGPVDGIPEAPDAGLDVGGIGDTLDGGLLDVNVDLDGDVGIAAPINGAVAANANVAAPIDAAVAANIGSVDSDAVAVSQQDAIINQTIEGSATADADQDSGISQP